MAVERSTQESGTSITGTGADVRQNSPTLITPIIQDASGVASLGTQIKYVTTEFDATSGTTGTTLTNLTGLTGFSVAAGAKYLVEYRLNTVATTNSGLKLALKLTTATLASIELIDVATSAAAVVATHFTTTTDQSVIYGATTAQLSRVGSGMLVTTLAGTIALQAAQNASHADTTSVYAGSWMRLTRVA